MSFNCKIKEEVLQDDEELCRLCAEKSSEYSSIFDDNLHESLAQNFRLSINPADNWPKSVCRKCSDIANVCLDFLSNIREAETTLRNIYGDLVEAVSLKSDIKLVDLPPDPVYDCFQDAEIESNNTNPEELVAEPAKPTNLKRKRGRKSTRIAQQKKKNFPVKPSDAKQEVTSDCDASEDIPSISSPPPPVQDTVGSPKRKKLSPEMKELKINRRNAEYFEEEDRKIRDFFQLTCFTCMESFERFLDLKNHCKQAHNREAYIMCCDKKLNSRDKIVNHLNYHTNPDGYKCSECDKSFLNAQRLHNHKLNRHTPKEQHRFKCPECSKSFMQQYNFNSHLIRHMSDEEKAFKCRTCHKTYATSATLKQHVRNTHEDAIERFICDICAKEIKGRHPYQIHVNNHKIKGVGDFSCPICEKKFKRKRLLKDHYDRHNTEGKIYKCGICGKISPNSHAQKNHIKLAHLKERQFECTLCDSAFKVKVALKEHMATHTGYHMLYTCLFCDKQFNSSSNRYVHQKQKHPVEYQAMREKRMLKERGLLDESA